MSRFDIRCVFCNELTWAIRRARDGRPYVCGMGNNPSPVKEHGRCCDKCNEDIVLVARMGVINASL